MTGGEHPEAGDAELLKGLQRHERTTTGEHDAAVLEAAAAAAATRRRERRRARSTWLGVGASLAAVAFAAVGLLWLVPLSDGPLDDPLLRGARAAVSPANGASLDAPPAAFEWPPQQGAVAYRVALLDAGARPVWRSDPSPENGAVVPEEVVRRLRDGGTWLWLVEIRHDGGTREIGPFSFAVASQ